MKLTVGYLYPNLLNLYGDTGNVKCLQKRLQWRGMEGEVCLFSGGSAIDFQKVDIVLLGGGSDREQEIACRYLKGIGGRLRDFVESGGVLLAVCGGYQLLGNYYRTQNPMIEGLGILDIYTEWKPERLAGDVILDSAAFGSPVVGFENHSGRTYIGNHTPFGRVRQGHGNTDRGEWEGVLYKNVVATYLHGPLLPKNPEVCDYLLERALKRKYGNGAKLEPLPDELEHAASQYIVKRYGKERRLG